MKPENHQWQQISRDYLAKIEKTLQGASENERRQILDEVAFHLNKRFDELGTEQQTWENMQAIITDMGPVEDYAAFLEEKPAPARAAKPKSLTFWINACILAAVLLSLFGTYGTVLLKQHLQSQRPVVIKTRPQTLSDSVDPAITQISVTFDQPMMNLSWSWVGGDLYPETTGEPQYDKERKTCTLPIKLHPGKIYWIGINSEKFVYFQTEKNIPAKPYAILFATADENGNPTEIPEDYIQEAKRINSK